MPTYKMKKRHFMNKYIMLLFTCVCIGFIAIYLLGLFQGMLSADSPLFYISAAFSILFLLISIYLILRLNSMLSPNELAAGMGSKKNMSAASFDSTTGLLYREAFFDEIRKILSKDNSLSCFAVIQMEALELLQRMVGRRKMEDIIREVAETLKNINDVKCICGCKSSNEFWLFLYGSKKDAMLYCLDSTIAQLNQIVNSISEFPTSSCVKCGYSWYPEQAASATTLSNNADFALYEAIIFKKKIRHEFSIDSYKKQEADYKRNALFDSILEEGSITHYFQPIIKAQDGSIYGYEALMRTPSDKQMTPMEILDIAQKQNRLYEIEKVTFFHVMNAVSQNTWSIRDKKIFINSIPNYQLNSKDFDALYQLYGNYMNQIVVEITESTPQTQESMDILHSYIHIMNGELALDDYGSGYSNDSNLLLNSPRYIKLDYSLISEINDNAKKQHLVANIVKFTKQYNIFTLAEGVETYDELMTVIRLGVDFIQGFYVAKPAPEFLSIIPSKIRDEIIGINIKLKSAVYEKNVYEVRSSPSVDLIDLALNSFSSIMISQKHTIFTGEVNKEVSFAIEFIDGLEGSLTLKNVNIRGNEAPCIRLGQNCNITLILVGKNTLSYEGIRVPESSKLTIIGEGDLSIKTDKNNAVCLGGNNELSFGLILWNCSGLLNILTGGDYPVGIGGNNPTENSVIQLVAGTVNISSSGVTAIGIGSFSGTSNIGIHNCNVSIICNADLCVGIGSVTGKVILDLNSAIKISLFACMCVGIGSINEANGDINLSSGNLAIQIKTRDGAAIGSFNGNVHILICGGTYNIYGEGSNICGIGNNDGTGLTSILDGSFSIDLRSTIFLPLGSRKGELAVRGGDFSNVKNLG